MASFRKKPVVIEAVEWTGQNHAEVHEFMTGAPPAIKHEAGAKAWALRTSEVDRLGLTIPTLEGDMLANVGDWIIKGIKGEFYPCKPDIFAASYDAVEPGNRVSAGGGQSRLATPSAWRSIVGRAAAIVERRRQRDEGMAAARAWRDEHHPRCQTCGGALA